VGAMAAKAKTKPATMAGAWHVEQIEIEKIKSALFERTEPGELEEMAKNIAKVGLQEPIKVRKLSDGSYQVIIGWRRLQAAKMAGLKTIPAIIDECDEAEAIAKSLSSDIFSKELTDYEIAIRIQRYMQLTGLKAVEVANKFGKSPAWISTKLSVLKAPEDVQQAVATGKISAEHARQLSKITDEKERKRAIEKATKAKLTVKEAKEAAEKEKEREEIKERIETLKKQLETEKAKLKEYDKAEERLKAIDEEIEELEKTVNKIDAELRELKTKAPNGMEFDLETVSDRIKAIEHDYEQKKAKVVKEEQYLKELEEKLKETVEITITFTE